jgi:hypothetical protein
VRKTQTYLTLGLAAFAAAGIAALALQRTPPDPRPIPDTHAAAPAPAAVTPVDPLPPAVPTTASADAARDHHARAEALRADPLSPTLRDAIARADASLAEADRLLSGAGLQPPDVKPGIAPTELSMRLVELRERFDRLDEPLER